MKMCLKESEGALIALLKPMLIIWKLCSQKNISQNMEETQLFFDHCRSRTFYSRYLLKVKAWHCFHLFLYPLLSHFRAMFHLTSMLYPILKARTKWEWLRYYRALAWSKLIYPPGNYLFKVNHRNTRLRCEICSKLAKETPERRHWYRSGVFIVNFGHISHLVPVFLLLNLSAQMPARWLFIAEVKIVRT